MPSAAIGLSCARKDGLVSWPFVSSWRSACSSHRLLMAWPMAHMVLLCALGMFMPSFELSTLGYITDYVVRNAFQTYIFSPYFHRTQIGLDADAVGCFMHNSVFENVSRLPFLCLGCSRNTSLHPKHLVINCHSSHHNLHPHICASPFQIHV